jgi:hypothetical protein
VIGDEDDRPSRVEPLAAFHNESDPGDPEQSDAVGPLHPIVEAAGPVLDARERRDHDPRAVIHRARGYGEEVPDCPDHRKWLKPVSGRS